MTTAQLPPPAGTGSGLVVTAVSVTLGGTTLLHGVDLVVPAGRWLTVTGTPGAGKSVLLQALAGLLPSRGTILLDGRPPDAGERPGIVLQDYALLPLLSAVETVSLPLQAQRLPRAEIRERAGTALAALGLSAASDQLVVTLSGGQRQRVAIARALAARPALLLLDEPTAELDAANRAIVLDLLRAEADRGAVLVVVTHDAAILERSDAVVALTPGGGLTPVALSGQPHGEGR